MPEITLNYWAIVATAAWSMVLGSIWYAKPVFGKAWMQLVGMTDEKAKQGAAKAMIMMVVAALVQAYVFAHVIDAFLGDTLFEGIMGGVWMWLGFVAAVTIADVFFAQRPMKLWVITSGYQLANLVVGGVILALWQ